MDASHVRLFVVVSQLRHIRIICMHIQMSIFSTLAEFTSPKTEGFPSTSIFPFKALHLPCKTTVKKTSELKVPSLRHWNTPFFVGNVYMGVSKNRGIYPQIMNFLGVFHYFHHPCWGVNTSIFWFNTHIAGKPLNIPPKLWAFIPGNRWQRWWGLGGNPGDLIHNSGTW